MIDRRSLVPLALALTCAAAAGTATGGEGGCVVDVGSAIGASPDPKTADVTPLAEGTWVGDVYVLPYAYPETYDRSLPGGADNVAARRWVAQSFFAHNPDAYDFLAVVTGFAFDAGWGQHGDPTHGLFWSVRNDTAGLGLELFDHSQLFGSSRLQGYIDANSLELVRRPDGTLDEDLLLTVLAHELGHRWLAYCSYDDGSGTPSEALLGVDGSHWSYLLDSDASYMYGADWRDNGDGSFTATGVKARYSALDLYLMGMLGAGEVEPFTLLVNPGVAGDQYPELGAIVAAAPTQVTVDQVIAAEGQRIPAAEDAPHELRIALVYLVEPGAQVNAEALDLLASARLIWQRRFFAETGGRGLVGVGQNSLPAAGPPIVDLGGAVAWLLGAADGDGRWADNPQTTGRDTAAAAAALDLYGGHPGVVAAALDALAALPVGPTEIEAWRAEALARHQHPASDALLDRLASWVLDEGAWGGGLRYAGDPATTARVARALAAGGRTTAAQAAYGWIASRQSADGGWPWRAGGASATAPTLEAVAGALTTDPAGWGRPEVQSAVGWLLARRSQGGVGDPHPDVIQTAQLLLAARGQGLGQDILAEAVSFIASRQRSDGSWGGRAFETAIAIEALAPFVQPDLSVSPSELLVDPADPFVDDQLTLTAAVRAGGVDVAAGVGYRWEVLDSAQIVVATLDGLLPAVPATLFSTVTDSWDLRHHVHPGDYTFRFVVDPDGELAESDEGNNAAELGVTFRQRELAVDLGLAPGDVMASPGFIGLVPATIVIDGVVRNHADLPAVNAVIAVFENGQPDALTSTTATVPRRGEAPFQLTVVLGEARPYRLAVVADPDDLLGDPHPEDNRVVLSLGVAQVFDPALVPGSFTATPAAGVVAGDLVRLDLELVNRGTEPVTGLQVGISSTAGDPPVTLPIRLLEVAEPLEPGEVRPLSLDWRPPVADPALRLSVEVDPARLVDDADRSNNTAELVLSVGPSLLPNLVASHAAITFDPEPALQHGVVYIGATVANPTDNPTGAFAVRLWIDEIGGGTLAGETFVPGLGPGESATVNADWTVDQMADRLVWLEVDGDDTVTEFDEDDNRDFRVLDVESIPDLVVTSGQLRLDPAYPHTGEPVGLEVTVLNAGDQEATDVGVELAVAGGSVVDSTTIPSIEGGAAATVTLVWPGAPTAGDTTLRVSADPAGSIVELEESNNQAEVAVTVQDADLWVVERYISPDGDGVKDSTAVFVREGVTEIEVFDAWGETVRRLAVEPGGRSEWDGRRDDGAALRDGVFELRADGLATWLEIDLNQVAITDDIRQPLISGLLRPLSDHPNARFNSTAPSPVDGVVYLGEFTGVGPVTRARRFAEGRLEDVPDWPAGDLRPRGLSADERVFLVRESLGPYALVRFPGAEVVPLTSPLSGAEPHLSPDGRWLLWVNRNAVNRYVVLQRVDDLGEVHQLGPYSTGDGYAWEYDLTLHWALEEGRAVISMHDPGPVPSAPIGLVLDIELEPTPSVRELSLDRHCGVGYWDSGRPKVSAAVDFENDLFYCTRDKAEELFIADLRDGSTVETVDLPNPGFGDMVWYRLTRSGRAVEIDEHIIPLLKELPDREPALLDWRRGHAVPWFAFGYSYGSNTPAWSPRDRFFHTSVDPSSTNQFFFHTPAANLAVALDPVVRFGGAGIDLFVTAFDRNLDHFRLEAAPAADPTAFEAIGQPSRERILGGAWGTWIPPTQGTWRVRLTAVDLAGNQRSVTRWVTWNGVSDIAGLWTEGRHISPVSSPGVQDELVWHYTVLRPAQLLFEILDPDGALLRRLPVGASQPGPRVSTWDGLDDAGRPVPDGPYRLVFRGAEWPVTVDNTPPAASFEIGDLGTRPTPEEIATAAGWHPPTELARSALFHPVTWSVADESLDRTTFEVRHVDQSEWTPLTDPTVFATTSEPAVREATVRGEWFAERVVRQVAIDLAGNRSVAERLRRDERLAFAVAEPPCRTDDEPCVFPDRPDIDHLGDADGLVDEAVAVLWPDYTTLLVQSTVWGDWRSTLRLEFRVPGSGGGPPGSWQPGTLTVAESPVWRRPTVLTGDPVAPIARLEARLLPVYWEHPGLPLRPYEVRLVATNRDGVDIASPLTLVVPIAPLTVEHLGADAAGDHFRVHNVSTAAIDGIVLYGTDDPAAWWPVAQVGELGPGMSTLVTTGCAFLELALGGQEAAWVRVEGRDPWNALQSSLPAAFLRAGPAGATSRPSFTLSRSSCAAGAPPALGMMGYRPGPGGRPDQCVGWSCDLGWHAPGTLVDLQVTVPAVDPNGTPVAGYELLIDGAVAAGAPELAPGTSGRVILDLAGLGEGPHTVSERYLFGPGDDGLLAGCPHSATLHVDRTVAATITSPTSGQSLCPDQGAFPIATTITEPTYRESYLIDGSTAGIVASPSGGGSAIAVAGLVPGPHLLAGEIVDLAGNAACPSVEFVSQAVAAVSELRIEPPVFSPVNTTGRPTSTVVRFRSTADAAWTAEVLDPGGGQIAVHSGNVGAGGEIAVAWDGRDLGGQLVADGDYGVRIRLDSVCGAVYQTPMPFPTVTVDTVEPTLVITSPIDGDELRVSLEIRGLVTDPHFERWEATIRLEGAPPGSATVIAEGVRPSYDPQAVLARVSVAHLDPGDYVLEVGAFDQPGNRAAVDPMTLQVDDRLLIASFGADPIYFSPNGDGAADTTVFAFELIHEAEVFLGEYDWVELVVFEVLPPGIVHTVTWDGLDRDQSPVPDGAYTFVLDVYDSLTGEYEDDWATVVVDRIAPTLVLASPPDGTLTALPITVSGFSEDLHADAWTVTLVHPDGSTVELAAGLGDWPSDATIALDGLADGAYRVEVNAIDLALNSITAGHDFVVDATAPSVSISAPGPGSIVDPVAEPLILRGVVVAAHPESLAWWIAAGADPAPGDFVLVAEQPLAAGGEVELPWTGPPPADGIHTLRLTTLDQLGRTAEDRRVVTFDATPPVVELWTPADGSLITDPVDITGLVADQNLELWTLDEITAGPTVRRLAAGIAATSDRLVEWAPLPADGPATLRLRAVDAAGHGAEVEVSVEVAVTPPGAPIGLTATVNGRDVALAWQGGAGPAPTGYHLERDGVRLTATPISQTTATDPGRPDGVYSYRVVAVGAHGRESEPSEPAVVVIDLTPPAAALTSPGWGRRVSGEVEVHGTAFSADDFAGWELAARPAAGPEWTTLATSTSPVIGGRLASWTTLLPPWADGDHELRLVAADIRGNLGEAVIPVVVDNTAPDPGPVNLQATLSALDPDGLANDVELSWTQTPTPPDLAGFYLYRNGLLANAPGPIVGDPTPYLLPGTSHVDRDVADGSHTYVVAAADTAGNLSALSSPAGPITIDTRRPHAVFSEPLDGDEIEGPVEVVVECPDGDVVSLDIEHRLAPSPDWLPLAPTFTGPPYVTLFSPPQHGVYELRAVAADAGGPDPAPPVIALTVADLAPGEPLQVTARVGGSDVNLTWIAPPDPAGDLAGFDIVRDGQVVNPAPLPPDTLSFLDLGLRESVYQYRVVAIDQAGHRTASDPVAAPVVTPFWHWVAPVTWRSLVTLAGGGAHASGEIEIWRTAAGQTTLVATVEADASGMFEVENAALADGANVFSVISRDAWDNTGPGTMPLLEVSRDPPDWPHNLAAIPDNGDVMLLWTATDDPESTGFSVARDGTTVNETLTPHPYDPATHTLSATGGDPASWAAVVDGSPSTGWAPERLPSFGRPEWWAWIWTGPFEIGELAVTWSATDPPQLFDVEVLTPEGWLWLATTAWSGQPTVAIPAGVAASGVRVRLPVTGACGTAACLPVLAEVAVTAVERTTDQHYLDASVPAGAHLYQVAHRTAWAQTSSVAQVSVALGPDEPLPPTALTAIPVDCGGIRLTWQPAAGQPGPLHSFRVYRADQAGGPWTLVMTAGSSSTTATDVTAPVGVASVYAMTSRVNVGGTYVESALSEPAGATAVCASPPPPVITSPTTSGHPITITLAQTPFDIRGQAVAGSTVTLLHDGAPVTSKLNGSNSFTFPDVPVHPGPNSYAVRQELLGTSVDSAPISVELDPATVPDLEAVSLASLPAAAAPGDVVVAEGVVGLHGPSGVVEVVVVALDLEAPDGAFIEVYRTTLALTAGESTTIRAAWTAAAPAGPWTWRLTVDPDDLVVEPDETDNVTTAPLRVLAGGGYEITARVDLPVYLVGQQLTGGAWLASAAPPTDVRLEVRLEDSAGRLVAMLAERDLPAFGGDWIELGVEHPLIGLYPGLYRVRAVAWVGEQTVAEALAPFTLEQPLFLAAAVSTDRSSYPEGQPVAVHGRIANLGPTFVDGIAARLAVVDETTGQTVATAVEPGIVIDAGGVAELDWSWPTAGAAPGPYRAELVVVHDAVTVVATADPAAFTVVPGEVRLAAELALSAATVEPGDPVTASVTVANTGPTDLGAVELSVRLVDPITPAVLSETIESASLPAGASHSFDVPFDTSGLELQRYVVIVGAAGDAGAGPFALDLASAALTVTDLTPPAVTVVEPAGGGVACESIVVTADVVDALSRVERVYFHLDDEPTAVAMHLADPAAHPSRYTATRPLPPGVDGPHAVSVHAEDVLGNLSGGEAVEFEADTLPPELVVTGPADGSCTPGPAAVVYSASDAHLASLEALLDGQPYPSGAPIAGEGLHVVEVAAVDECGRTATDARSFVVDSTPPVITVTGVSQGAVVVPGTVVEWTVADINLVSATAALDGAPVVSPLVLGVAGPHTLVVAGVDCAGNTAELAIQFEVVEAVLALGGQASATPPVIEPGQGLAVAGQVTNLGTALEGVLLTLDVVQVGSGAVVAGHGETTDLAAGQVHGLSFSPDTAGWPLGGYEARLTARGQFLGQPFELAIGSAPLTLADLIAPQLTLLGPSPGLACEAITVSAEAVDLLTGVAAVTVAVDGGAPLPLANTGGAVWSAPLALSDGPHGLAVVATDGAGNPTPPVSVAIDLDTAAPSLTVTTVDDGACVDEPVTIVFTADDPHLAGLEATLDGAPIASGHTVVGDGAYHLVVVAGDACGRETTDERHLIIDTVEPEVTVAGISDGAVYATGVPGEWQASDANLVSAAATLDGSPVDPTFAVTTVGAHLLEVTAEDCAGHTAAESVAFDTVAPGDGLGGTIAADPAQVEPPQALAVSATVDNLIATDYPDLVLRLELVDPATGSVVASHEVVTDLAAGASLALEHAFDTGGLALGEHRLSLGASGVVYGGAVAVELASAVVEIVDRTPPTLALEAPSAGLACLPIEVRARAADALSGVESVRVHVDHDPTGVPLSDAGNGLWTVALTLDDGSHHLEVVARDAVGNETTPAAVDVDLDLAPPELTVTAPAPGECGADTVTLLFTAADPHLVELRAMLDGEPVASGVVVSADGDHQLRVDAEDACGRTATFSTHFVVDASAPVITVEGAAPGDEFEPPVTLAWTVDEPHLTEVAASLDGEPAIPPVVVETPGPHLLVVETADCAGNTARVEVPFTILDDPTAGLVIPPPALDAGASVLLLDRSAAGGDELEGWLADHAGRVTRVTDGCAFLTELRRARHELVVLWAPSGATPLETPACGVLDLPDLAAELAATAYRRGGLLVLGDGMTGDGCLGCLLDATGVRQLGGTTPQLAVEPMTEIIDLGPDAVLFGPRGLDPAGGFPLLVGGSGGQPVCDGLRGLTLELIAETPGPWAVEVGVTTPHEALARVAGTLDDGDRLEAAGQSWVDLVAQRSGDRLTLELHSAHGGALPDWLAVDASVWVTEPGAPSPVEASTWLGAGCGLAPGTSAGGLAVTSVEPLAHDTGHTIAAAARRWGRGESLVLPWDVLDPANAAALTALEQALVFALPGEPRRAVAGQPLPVSFAVGNTADRPKLVRLEAEVPEELLVEVWGEPTSLAPVRWELEIAAGGTAERTLWIAAEAGAVSIPYTVAVADGGGWQPVDGGTVVVDVEASDRAGELRDLHRALLECAGGADDPGVRAVLRDVLAALDRVAVAGDDATAAEGALVDLGRAFAAAAPEPLPCVAELRRRLADLVALWQARWVTEGGGS